MNGELAGKGVTHLVTCAAEGCIKGLVVVADAIVGKHQVDGLLGADSEVATEARLKVEAVGHLDLIGTETNIGTQIHGEEWRYLGGREIGLQASEDLDVIADILTGAVIGVASAAVILEAGVIEAVEVLVTGSGSDEEVVAKAITAHEIHAEGEVLVLVETDAAGGLNRFFEALGLTKGNDCRKNQDARKNESTHRKRYRVKQYGLSASH